MLTLVYSDIQEDESEKISFEKATVQFVLNNIKKVERMIMVISKTRDRVVVDDILSELVEYLAGCADYDINYALKEETGTLVSLENYVAVQTKFCCQRYRNERYEFESHNLSFNATIKKSTRSSKESDTTIGDFIADKTHEEIENLCYNIDESLYEMRYIRAIYSVDIYLMLYIRLRVRNEENYMRALEACGYNKKEIQRVEEKILKTPELKGLIKAITLKNVDDDAASYIAKYVYCIDAVNAMLAVIGA